MDSNTRENLSTDSMVCLTHKELQQLKNTITKLSRVMKGYLYILDNYANKDIIVDCLQGLDKHITSSNSWGEIACKTAVALNSLDKLGKSKKTK